MVVFITIIKICKPIFFEEPMSDEKKTDTEDWQIDSLDEEDDIIELTEEIEPPPPPRARRSQS